MVKSSGLNSFYPLLQVSCTETSLKTAPACIMSANNSQVPNPAHIQADSMLARRFGKETVNYFSSKFSEHHTSTLRTNTDSPQAPP